MGLNNSWSDNDLLLLTPLPHHILEEEFITNLDRFHFLPLFHTFTQEELSCGQLLVHLQRRSRIMPTKQINAAL